MLLFTMIQTCQKYQIDFAWFESIHRTSCDNIFLSLDNSYTSVHIIAHTAQSLSIVTQFHDNTRDKKKLHKMLIESAEVQYTIV
jgi:hypothetical protein